VPGGQAELLRVPQAHYGPIKVPERPPDERFLYLSDVLPTAWQAVEGQANVRRWTDEILPLVTDESDPLGVEDLASHRLALEQAPHAYEIFDKKQDGAIKIVLVP
jgi:threonine dehydrogenase-like Zn-dependent dehydrogenase